MNGRSYTVLGGDARMRYLVLALREAGFPTAMCCVPGLADDGTPKELLPKTDTLILPFPALGSDGNILGTKLAPETVLNLLPEGARIFCGKAGDVLGAYPGTTDLLVRPGLTVRNAALSAEGAVQLAMVLLPCSILQGRFLVVGAGRIGTALAGKLRSLGAEVTVSARKDGDLARIECAGFRAERTGVYTHGLNAYDAVFNTVPAQVFKPEQLTALSEDCLYLELASAPGGVDDTGKALLGARYISGSGLPGRCMPKTAGELILREILACLEEARV